MRVIKPHSLLPEPWTEIMFSPPLRSSPQERQQRVLDIKSSINQKLIESGERDRLKELLRTRLVECGWRDEMKACCKDIIKDKGVENVSIDELIAEITPKGRATVPDIIKRELLHEIKAFMADLEDIGW